MSLPQPPNLTPEQRQAQMDALRALYGERATFKPSPEDQARAKAEGDRRRKDEGKGA